MVNQTPGPDAIIHPRVSILTTVWNGEAHLGSAIESVVGQTFDDWEHIIVDDGSTDDTVSIIKKFDDPRIRLIGADRIGRGAALNLGLEACRGDYVAVFDADDLCSRHRLQYQVELLDKNPHIDLLCSAAVFSEGELPTSMKPEPPVLTILPPSHLIGRNIIIHSTVAMRRKVLVSVNGYDQTRRNLFDFELWIRLAQADHLMAICNIPIAMFRIHKGQNFTQKNRLQYLFAAMKLRLRAASCFGDSAIDYILPVAGFLYGLLPSNFRVTRNSTRTENRRTD